MATTRRRGATARALQVANLVLAAVLTGHELGTLGVLHPVLQRLPYADEVAGEQLLPINLRTLRWDAAVGDEAEWRRVRRRWDRLHVLRTGLDLGGLAALTAAALHQRR